MVTVVALVVSLGLAHDADASPRANDGATTTAKDSAPADVASADVGSADVAPSTPKSAAVADDARTGDVARTANVEKSNADAPVPPPDAFEARRQRNASLTSSDDDDDQRVGRAPSEGMGDLFSTFLKTMLMLALVIGAAYLTLHKGVGKLLLKAQQGQRVRVVERISLGDRRGLFLVTVDGKEMLLGASEGGISVLDKKETTGFTAILDESRSRNLAAGDANAMPNVAPTVTTGSDNA